MDNYQSSRHTKWECQYHIIWIPKYRKKKLSKKRYGKTYGVVFRELARRKECEVLEEHLMPDHVHMLLSIPPKYAVAQVVGFIKGKSAMYTARTFGGRKRNFTGQYL